MAGGPAFISVQELQQQLEAIRMLCGLRLAERMERELTIDTLLDVVLFCDTNLAAGQSPTRTPFCLPRHFMQDKLDEHAVQTSKSHLGELEKMLTDAPAIGLMSERCEAASSNLFLLKSPPGFSMNLSSDRRTVSRMDKLDEPVHLCESLQVNHKLVLRVDESAGNQFTFAFVFALKHGLDAEISYQKDVSDFASPGCTVSFELASAKTMVVIMIVREGVSKISYLYLPGADVTSSFFPVILMNGNARTITIVDVKEKKMTWPPPFKPVTGRKSMQNKRTRPGTKDPIRKRPNSSSTRPASASSSASASSAYSSQSVTPSPPKNLSTPAAATACDFETSAIQSLPIEAEAKVKKSKTSPTTTISDQWTQTIPVFKKSSQLEVDTERRQTGPRKWFGNQFMTFNKPLITQIRSSRGKNYIFGSEFRVNQGIIFKLEELDDDAQIDSDCSIYWGFTHIPLLELDLSSLPADPKNLEKKKTASNKWFVSGNLFKAIGVFDGLKLTRTETGISLSIASDPQVVEAIHTTSSMDRIFPFFHLSGGVKSIDVQSES